MVAVKMLHFFHALEIGSSSVFCQINMIKYCKISHVTEISNMHGAIPFNLQCLIFPFSGEEC